MVTNKRPRDVHVNPSAKAPVVIQMTEDEQLVLDSRVGELRDRHEHGMAPLKMRERRGRASIPSRAMVMRLAVRQLLRLSNEQIEQLLVEEHENETK